MLVFFCQVRSCFAHNLVNMIQYEHIDNLSLFSLSNITYIFTFIGILSIFFVKNVYIDISRNILIFAVIHTGYKYNEIFLKSFALKILAVILGQTLLGSLFASVDLIGSAQFKDKVWIFCLCHMSGLVCSVSLGFFLTNTCKMSYNTSTIAQNIIFAVLSCVLFGLLSRKHSLRLSRRMILFLEVLDRRIILFCTAVLLQGISRTILNQFVYKLTTLKNVQITCCYSLFYSRCLTEILTIFLMAKIKKWVQSEKILLLSTCFSTFHLFLVSIYEYKDTQSVINAKVMILGGIRGITCGLFNYSTLEIFGKHSNLSLLTFHVIYNSLAYVIFGLFGFSFFALLGLSEQKSVSFLFHFSWIISFISSLLIILAFSQKEKTTKL